MEFNNILKRRSLLLPARLHVLIVNKLCTSNFKVAYWASSINNFRPTMLQAILNQCLIQMCQYQVPTANHSLPPSSLPWRPRRAESQRSQFCFCTNTIKTAAYLLVSEQSQQITSRLLTLLLRQVLQMVSPRLRQLAIRWRTC